MKHSYNNFYQWSSSVITLILAAEVCVIRFYKRIEVAHCVNE